jgi:hypothetical protein
LVRAAALALGVLCAGLAASADPTPLPERLSDTGLFVAGTRELRPDLLPFSPQYPLWSDGATKRRWLYLPPGTTIDASDPDAWVFPSGTRLWKEFAHDRPVETRVIERLSDGSWGFSAYAWDADGREAWLVPAEGIPAQPAPGAPDGRYVIPSRDDCLACHEGAAVPVLGFGALQLSADRDPLAPHAENLQPGFLTLETLLERGLLAPAAPLLTGGAPRIPAASPGVRAAFGYLHANCGHCHNDRGPLAAMELVLAQSVAVFAAAADPVAGSTVGRRADSLDAGYETRVVAGHPETSALMARMESRHPFIQMPPLGTRVVDAEGLDLVRGWIQHELGESLP